MVLTAESVKGRAVLALLIQPRHRVAPQAKRSWGGALVLSASRSAAVSAGSGK